MESTLKKKVYISHIISGRSIFLCQAISKCSLVETTFLLLVTVSTVRAIISFN